MTTSTLAIALTAHNRCDRLDKLLGDLAAAHGAANWQLYLSIEPTPEVGAIQAVVKRHTDRLRITHRVNADRLGVRRNPFETVQWAMAQGHDVILLLEDDLRIDTQGLRLAELLTRGPLQGSDIMCANLLTTTCMSESIFMPAEGEEEALANVVLRTRFFSSYGLLFTGEQWQRYFVPNWFIDAPQMENFEGHVARGWDVAMTRTLLVAPSLRVLQSLLPRVTHDGADGTHVDVRFQASSFAHVRVNLAPTIELAQIRVLDPLADLDRVPGAAARMYINLARHLWTLQASSLIFKHTVPDLHGSKARWWRLGRHEYLLHRRRVR